MNMGKESRQNVWNFPGINKDVLKKENDDLQYGIGNAWIKKNPVSKKKQEKEEKRYLQNRE